MRIALLVIGYTGALGVAFDKIFKAVQADFNQDWDEDYKNWLGVIDDKQ